MGEFLVVSIVVIAIVGVIWKLSNEPGSTTANALSSLPKDFIGIIYG